MLVRSLIRLIKPWRMNVRAADQRDLYTSNPPLYDHASEMPHSALGDNTIGMSFFGRWRQTGRCCLNFNFGVKSPYSGHLIFAFAADHSARPEILATLGLVTIESSGEDCFMVAKIA